MAGRRRSIGGWPQKRAFTLVANGGKQIVVVSALFAPSVVAAGLRPAVTPAASRVCWSGRCPACPSAGLPARQSKSTRLETTKDTSNVPGGGKPLSMTARMAAATLYTVVTGAPPAVKPGIWPCTDSAWSRRWFVVDKLDAAASAPSCRATESHLRQPRAAPTVW